jgi:IS605 OrfB family transposase
MINVERHFIKSNDVIESLCGVAAKLYNKVNYIIRQSWFNHTLNLNLQFLYKSIEIYNFQLHNTKTIKQIIRRCIKDWTTYFKSIEAFYKNPKNFKCKPNIPGYKNKVAQIIFYNETIRKTKKNIIQPTNDIFKVFSNIKDFKQIIVNPKSNGFMVDIQYEKEINNIKPNKINFISIDAGIKNLCTISSNQIKPYLIKGSIIKSWNQYVDKFNTKFNEQKRYFRIENYFHHVSKDIIDNCVKNDIGTIYIGRNKGWKQGKSLRKKTRKNFQKIPYFNLWSKIEYKALLNNINVEYVDESYTSKASFIDKDFLPESYDSENHYEFSGKRIKRGLYRSMNGTLLNSDLNGSMNIARKVVSQDIEIDRLSRSVAATLYKVNPLKVYSRKASPFDQE